MSDNHIGQAGMLSDKDILGYLDNGIEIYTEKGNPPFDPATQIQPASVDLRFRNGYRRFTLDKDKPISHKNEYYTAYFELKGDEPLVIAPGEIILASTLEHVHLSKGFAGLITGRSSIARLGVMVQCCQDFVNPGHKQAIGLQIVNLSPNPVELELNYAICQLIIFRLASEAENGYADKPNPKYADETTPLSSRIFTESRSAGTDNQNALAKIKVKRWLRKWVEPFLPSLFASTVVVALLYNNIKDRPLSDVFRVISEMPLGVIFAAVVIAVYIWMKGDSRK